MTAGTAIPRDGEFVGGHRPHGRPKLGQHFLRDINYAQRSVDAAGLRPDDVVLEVGPGQGFLTRLLAPRVERVIAIELDDALADALEPTLPENVTLLRGDAVQIEWPEFTTCVSNLPYQISSPFLFRLLACDFRVAVLLLQKEFADRLKADVDTSEYGRLTVNASRRADVERIARVPPGAFNPPPRVDSAIVRITPRPPPFDMPDEATYERVVEAAFGQRRKKIGNALSSLPQSMRARLSDVPFADKRAGELTPEDFARVTRHILGAPP